MNPLCVSFPRSGSQFLVDNLRAAIPDDLRWCEGCEDNFDSSVHNMLKTHDFDLTARAPDGWSHIVQIRDPLDAVPSWFDVQVRRYGQEDTYDAWLAWARGAFVFWSKFVRKWVLNSHPELVIQYQDLAANPDHYVEHIAYLLTGTPWLSTPTPIERRAPSKHRDFRYYKKSDFQFFASLCACEMRILGYEVKA